MSFNEPGAGGSTAPSLEHAAPEVEGARPPPLEDMPPVHALCTRAIIGTTDVSSQPGSGAGHRPPSPVSKQNSTTAPLLQWFETASEDTRVTAGSPRRPLHLLRPSGLQARRDRSASSWNRAAGDGCSAG